MSDQPGKQVDKEQMGKLFAEVLGLPEISPQDSFFDLGGHSLLASKLAKRIYAEFGIKVPLRTVYEAPTVEALVAHLNPL